MKFHHLFLATAAPFAALQLTSCDGGSSGEEDLTVAELDLLRAESLIASDFTQGDTIRWTPSAEFVQNSITDITLGPAGDTSTPFFSYEYRQEGTHSFSFTERNLSDPRVALEVALDNTLSAQSGTDVSLGAPIREILNRDSPNFTNSELNDLLTFLNPSGANLTLLPNGDLIVTTITTFFNEVNSTRGDQRRGSMGGVYFAESSSFDITFTEATDQEEALYRFTGLGRFWIPRVNTSSFNGTPERTEEGTWTIEFVNRVD